MERSKFLRLCALNCAGTMALPAFLHGSIEFSDGLSRWAAQHGATIGELRCGAPISVRLHLEQMSVSLQDLVAICEGPLRVAGNSFQGVSEGQPFKVTVHAA